MHQEGCDDKGGYYHRDERADGEYQGCPDRVRKGEASVILREYVDVVLQSDELAGTGNGTTVRKGCHERVYDRIEAEYGEKDKAGNREYKTPPRLLPFYAVCLLSH